MQRPRPRPGARNGNGKSLGSEVMADLYSGHDFAEQRLDCMERWADRIAATLSDNVVTLKQDTA